MKNFFKNIKNYVTEHKVKTITTAIAVILITALIIVGITATKTETPKVADKKIIKVETKKKVVKKEDTKKTETAKEEVKQEEEVKSTDKTESPAIKEETVNKSSKSTGNATSKPAANKPAAKPSTNTSKPATKTPRWVVDRAAWTETKQVPVYDYVYVYRVYGIKNDTSTEYIGNYYSYDEAYTVMGNFDRSKYASVGYEVDQEKKLIRTDTQTINHPEEGHWEY